jgi:hypothetical protein
MYLSRVSQLSVPHPNNGSALLFRLIAAHVAVLTRPFDEAVLPVRAFLNGCSLVAERVNRLPGQIRGLASASSFGGRRCHYPNSLPLSARLPLAAVPPRIG